MKSRIRPQKKRTTEQVPGFPTTPAEPMFQSRPFVVQTQTAEKSQQPDLKTALKRAELYGHNLSRMQPTGVPAATAVQPKMGMGLPVHSERAKVHTDAQSDQLTQSIQAKALTTGQDILFRQGEYNPGSRGGKELIAHELTHVVQQNGGKSIQRTQEYTQQEKKIHEARNTPQVNIDHAYMAFCSNYNLNHKSTPSDVFQAILKFTKGGTYSGQASSIKQGLGANAWNCESLAHFMVEMCQVAADLMPNLEKRWQPLFNLIPGTVGALKKENYNIKTLQGRQVSEVGIKPHMSCFKQGNVITTSAEGLTDPKRRTSFESHTTAVVDGVDYDPLMGEIGSRVTEIWAVKVGSDNKVTIDGIQYEYVKSLTEKEGPISIGRLHPI